MIIQWNGTAATSSFRYSTGSTNRKWIYRDFATPGLQHTVSVHAATRNQQGNKHALFARASGGGSGK
jgi:hypothetical protein